MGTVAAPWRESGSSEESGTGLINVWYSSEHLLVRRLLGTSLSLIYEIVRDAKIKEEKQFIVIIIVIVLVMYCESSH